MSALYSLLVLCLLVLCGGRLLYEQYYGEQDCEMTWMYMWPQYLRVPMSDAVEDTHPQYGLYLYTEGPQKDDDSLELTDPLSGVPVLFVPGNAGSHKQVRSSASIALRMFPAEFKHLRHFDFFTVKLNEELSGVFGGVLRQQVEYVQSCIDHILSLYSHLPYPPQSVVIIAHSMGGVVTKALFSLPNFNASYVHTIIAMASPLLRPVISFDPLLQDFYRSTEQEVGVAKLGHVTLVSIAGGVRDVMVPAYLTTLPGAVNLASPAVPRNWVSADHQAIVWCRRVQLALIRALFLLQDPSRHELTRDKKRRDDTLTHLLLKGREVPLLTTPTSNVQIKTSLVAMVNETTEEGVVYHHEGTVGRYRYVGMDLKGQTPVHVVSNTGRDSWLFVCQDDPPHHYSCVDLSSRASLLPPKVGVVKQVSLLPSDWSQGKSLLVVAQPSNLPKQSKGFLTLERCHAHNTVLNLRWWAVLFSGGMSLTIPTTHCSLVNISLPHLQEVLQTYTATFTSSCGDVRARLVTPWYPHTHSHLHHPHNVTMSLSLLVPPPLDTYPHLLVWCPPDCPLNINITAKPLELLDKLTLLYTPLLLPWVTAVCIAGQHWSPGYEVLVLTILHALASNGWIPYTDWELLISDGMWNGFAPVAVHLIARGLGGLLFQLVKVGVAIIRKICGRGTVISWMCMLMSVPCAMVCSGVGGVCLILGWAFKASSVRDIYILCVLICLEMLTLPAVGSWFKGLSFSGTLSPDPHCASILATICLTVTLAWLPELKARTLKRYSLIETLLAIALLLYCTLHVHRMASLILVYLVVSVARQLI